MNTPRAALCFLLLAHSISQLSALPGDQHWAWTFGRPGPTNVVFAMAVKGDNVYASGFWNAGVISSTNWIERWDGAKWSALPGLFRGSMPIYDAVFIGDDLYVCGMFTHIDDAPAPGVARWNGQSWTAIGDVNGLGIKLATDGTNLYMGGIFTNIGGVNITNIAKWDGQAWSQLGDGLGVDGTAEVDSYVSAVHWNGTALYAGGRFTSSGASAVSHLARWNGSTWEAVGGGVDGPVFDIASGGDDLYAGGDFLHAGSVPANAIARFNGSTWSPLGSGLTGFVSPAAFRGPVFAIGVAGTNVIAGGSFTNAGGIRALRLARWDGSAWSSMGNMNDMVERIRVVGPNVYIGGLFTQADNLIVNQVAVWNGSDLRALGTKGRSEGAAFPGLRSLAIGNGRVYAGGLFTGIGTVRASRIACWDGTNWAALGTGVQGTNTGTGTSVSAIAVNDSGHVFVGGSFTNAGGISARNVARWDGSNWFPLGDGIPGAVSAIAVRGSDVFVAGTFQKSVAGEVTAFNIAKWDGSEWSRLPGGAFAGLINNFTVTALAVSGNDLYLGGNFFAAGFEGGSSTNIVKHDGSDWVPMGGGVNSNVTAIVVVGSDVYVGGRFNRAGNVTASRIARWNGSAWSDVGGGVGGTGNFQVSALAAIGSDVFVGGNFTTAGGLDAGRIALWNGSAWSPLGGGLSRSFGTPSVLALAASGDDLFVGGNFEGAGNKPANYIAQWNGTRDFDTLPAIAIGEPQRLPNGSFEFTVRSQGIDSYVVESSINLTNWIPLQTNTAASATVTDPGAAGTLHQFYRARQVP